MKFLATSLLVVSVFALIVARLYQPQYPVLGFIAAFAEAAAIGGMADWYAVVALFRRPFGLPIPHTAIIPENQNRIADRLGEFIETNFLSERVVATKLQEIDFSAHISQWMNDSKRTRSFSTLIVHMLPDFLPALEKSNFKTFLTRRILVQLQTIDLAPLAAGLMRSIMEDDRHQKILDRILEALHRLLKKPETLEALRTRIREETPSLLNLYRIDFFIFKRIVSSTDAFVDEVRKNANHQFRREFDGLVNSFIDSVSHSPEYAAKIEGMKRNLLARPELKDLSRVLWSHLRVFIEEQSAFPHGPLQKSIETILVEVGRQITADAQLRKEINHGMIALLSSVVSDQKSEVSKFISEQMKSWDIHQLVSLIELNVGKDLQYIRLNGSLIGGLIGLGLYTIEYLARL